MIQSLQVGGTVLRRLASQVISIATGPFEIVVKATPVSSVVVTAISFSVSGMVVIVSGDSLPAPTGEG